MILIWLVEDDAVMLRRIERELKQFEPLVEIRSDRDWDLARLEQDSGRLPDVVVLDLVQGEGLFRGREFYARLRQLEKQQHKRECFVALFTEKSLMAEASSFIEEALANSNRVVRVEPKNPSSLCAHIRGCLARLEEEE